MRDSSPITGSFARERHLMGENCMRALKPRVKLFGFVAALLAGVVLVGVDEAGAQGLGSIIGGTVGSIVTHSPPVATRDHRTPPPVATRDHRTPPPVATRDHRTSRSVEVRDHGANRIATVPVTVTRSHK
jgi:hypothetical protein